MAMQSIGKVSKNKTQPSKPNPVENQNKIDGNSMHIPQPDLPEMSLFTTTILENRQYSNTIKKCTFFHKTTNVCLSQKGLIISNSPETNSNTREKPSK